MSFPPHVPSARAIELGDWPIKTFRAIDGAEVRILYGSQETEAKMSLTYEHVSDTTASDFITHYRSVRGTFERFPLDQNIYSGWQGISTAGPDQAFRPTAARWRYAAPPKISNIRPGISTVQVDLVAVL